MLQASDLVLLSERSVKCKLCGMRGDKGSGQNLYWWQDSAGGKHLIHGNSYGATRYGVMHMTRCDSEGMRKWRVRHNVSGRLTFDELQTHLGGGMPTPTPNGEEGEEEEETPIPPANVDLTELKRKLREELSRMVTEAIGEIRPTKVEIVTPDETKPLPDMVHQMTPDVIRALSVGANVWMSGPAGSGKTTIARHCAEAFGTEFRYVALSFDMPRNQLVGYMDANGKEVRTDAMDAWEYGYVLLMDECDAGNPNVLLVAQAMRDMPVMAFAGRMIPRHPNFKFVAAGNTIGTGADAQYQGRAKLDAAFLNGFVRVRVEYDLALENAIAHAEGAKFEVNPETIDRWLRYLRGCRANAVNMRLHTVISPRQAKDGARLFGAGFGWERVADLCIREGMTDADWAKVSEGVVW